MTLFKNHNKRRWVVLASIATVLFVATTVGIFIPQQAYAQFYDTKERCELLSSCKNACVLDDIGFGQERWVCKNTGGVQNAPARALEGAASTILNPIAFVLLSFAALLLGISGVVLNLAIDLTVVKMAAVVGEIGTINIAWELVRDVVNMLFIFILLAIAISIILRAGPFNSRQILTRLVIAALLINFSLFFTRVIIDTSNILTAEFYKPIATAASRSGSIDIQDAQDKDKIDVSLLGFSAAFAQPLQLTSIFKGAEFTEFSTVVRQLSGTAFLLIAAFVFFAVAILLAIRFVIFVLLMVTSPVAFLGLILPKGAKASGMWWSALWGEAIWAPVFMLLATLTLLIIRSDAFTKGILNPTESYAEAFIGAGSMIVVLNFIIVITFLIAAITIAKSMARGGSNGIVKWAGKAPGNIGRAVGSFAGRQTLGRGARALGERYDQTAAQIGGSRFAKRLESLPVLGAVTGAAAGVADRAVRSGLKTTEGAKYGGVSLAESEKRIRERRRELGKTRVERGREEKINTGIKAIKNMDTAGTYDADNESVKDFYKNVGDITSNGIKEMLENNLKQLKDTTFASALTSGQVKTIIDSVGDGLVSEEDKGAILKARTDGMKKRITAARASGNLNQEIGRITSGKAKDVAQLPRKLYFDDAGAVTVDGQDIISKLTPGTLAAIVRDDTLSSRDRAAIRNQIGIDAARGEPYAAALNDWLTTTPQGRSF